MRLMVVSHDGCPHESEKSWNLALAAALAHAGKTMGARSRESVIRMLMNGDEVTHQGAKFTGEVKHG